MLIPTLVLLGSLTFGFWYIWDQFTFKYLPPGPPRLPILGNILHLGVGSGRRAPFVVFRKLCKIYGSLVALKIGPLQIVTVDDYETAKKILNDENWEDRHNDGAITGCRSFGKPLGIIFSNGKMWKEIRKFTIKTLREFGFGKKRTMEAFIEDEIAELLLHIDHTRENNEDIVNIKHLFTLPVLNILWSVVGGARFENNDRRLLELISIIEEMAKAAPIGSGILVGFPFLRHIAPESTGYSLHLNGNEKLHSFFREIIRERREQGIYKTNQNDFIDVFLSEIDRHNLSKTKPNYFTAGSETTSNTLEFAIQYVLFNPSVQTKIQAEIDEKIGNHEFPSVLRKNELPYTEATIWEIQRMCCVLPLIGRSAIKDCVIQGYKIPKKTVSLLNVYSLHYNEKHWEDPLEFRPERFLDSHNKIDNSQTQKVLAFGAGKRVCIGESLTRATLFSYFATLLQKYKFSICEDLPIPSKEPHVGFTLSPQPFMAVVTRRGSHFT